MKRHHFGLRESPIGTSPLPYISTSVYWQGQRRCALNFKEIISDGRFESEDRKLIRQLVFFFRDSIDSNNNDLFDSNYKWLRQIGDQRFFLPNMER